MTRFTFIGATICTSIFLLSSCALRLPKDSANAFQLLEAELIDIVGRYPDQSISVSIRDSRDRSVVNINADEVYHAASTMKVPVMMEIFRRVDLGLVSLDDSIDVHNEFSSIVDGSPFSLGDDVIFDSLGMKMTLRELVHWMITVSSNLATNILIDEFKASNVQSLVEQLGITSMRVLRGVEDIKAFDLGLSNSTTSNDLALLMNLLMNGTAISTSADSAMVDVLLRAGESGIIPPALPESTKVGHKTGGITGILHDAAIVYPRDSEPYVLVLLTRGFEKSSDATMVMREITRTVHARLRPKS